MLNQPEPACLVIADISGYTGFLAGAELDHAQDILADLMNTVVNAFRPSFRLAKLEGDAAFVCAITETVDGPLLQDTVERCYFAFRRRLRDVGQASTCECNACVLVPALDLMPSIPASAGLSIPASPVRRSVSGAPERAPATEETGRCATCS